MGIDTSPVGTPPRLRCTASASVPVARPEASTVKGIFSAVPASNSSSKTALLSVEPRVITGPEPSSCLPASLTSMPGASVAWVTSTTIATSGSSEKALVREPPNVVSSCAAATAATSHPPPPPPPPPPRPPRPAAQPGCLERPERSQAVVERARDEPSVGQLHGLGVDHGDVA